MSTITQAAANTAAQVNAAAKTQETNEVNKKTKVYGKTIGSPQLSEKAAEYYEKLKEKYAGMDFILVSKDMKEQAQAQAGSYANASKMVVLIDEEKIERMAEDQAYRRQYEGIIRNAAVKMPELQSSLSAASANVKGYGIKVNDNGTTSFFAVIDKSLAAQKERIEKKAEEKKKEQKAEEKKAEQKAEQERLEEIQRADSAGDGNTITVTASSVEELVQKINDLMYDDMSQRVRTAQEKMIGQHVDFSL